MSVIFETLTILFQILNLNFLSLLFSCFAFFKFSHSWTINSMRQMQKGSVPFLLSGCEDITAQCKNWQISFQASLLICLLKESCTSWQIKGMAVDFFFSTLSIAFCSFFSAYFLAYLRIGNCTFFMFCIFQILSLLDYK